MRWVVAMLFIVALALATPALKANDFTYSVSPVPVSISGTSVVNLNIQLSAEPQKNAFDVLVRFSPPASVSAAKTTQTLPVLRKGQSSALIWQLTAAQPGSYDLSNAFEIVSWDDSVKLEVDALTETQQKDITITGRTDDASLCTKQGGAGFWAQQENCQTRVTINGIDAWADKDGAFAVPITLTEGINPVTIAARDPGGNTEEQTMTITYSPSLGDQAKENTLPISLITVVVVAGSIGAIVYARGKSHSETVARKVVDETSLDDLREKQTKLFVEFAKNTGMSGMFDDRTATTLLEIFQKIASKDQFYTAYHPDLKLAVKEHEAIFKNEQVSAGIRNLLLERYAKALMSKPF